MKLIFLYFLLLISYAVSGQELVGKWYSQDSTRIYHIYKNHDQFEAVLEKSSRKTDKEGVMILRHVMGRGKKKGFEGEIYSVDGQSTLAKIRFEENDQVLRLRLRRMFFMNVTIKWYRVEENRAAQL
ncbi:MAG: hypothetical protein ACXWV1_13115 [Chitinophagaceae bacterium]